MDKKDFIEQVVILMEGESEKIKSSFESSRKAAIEAPGAMQSKSDTTKSQMSVLAGNFHDSFLKLQSSIAAIKRIDVSKKYERVGVGAIVLVQEGKTKAYYFVMPPDSGSHEVQYGDGKVCTISLNSPIAQALVRKKAGEQIKFQVPAGLRIFRILQIE